MVFRTHPATSCDPSRNGRVSGKRFVEFSFLKIGFWHRLVTFVKPSVYHRSALPLYPLPRPCEQGRQGRNLLRGGFRGPV